MGAVRGPWSSGALAAQILDSAPFKGTLRRGA